MPLLLFPSHHHLHLQRRAEVAVQGELDSQSHCHRLIILSHRRSAPLSIIVGKYVFLCRGQASRVNRGLILLFTTKYICALTRQMDVVQNLERAYIGLWANLISAGSIVRSLKLGNVWTLVQLILSPPWPANQLYKNPNIAQL